MIRVVGPGFDVVSAWQRDGVPFKVACEGIDRYVERYNRKGPRRRPVRVEFCDADVRDVFDEWRRATGVVAGAGGPVGSEPAAPHGASLPEHLERALIRLTNARATGALSDKGDPILDAVSQALDESRVPGGLRGPRRQELLVRLGGLDRQLARVAFEAIDAETRSSLEAEADADLAAFRTHMPDDRFARAREQVIDRLVRARRSLPVLSYA